MGIKATAENGILKIEIPMYATPVLSSSKKSLVVASSHGNQTVDVKVGGQLLKVGVNAFIPAPGEPAGNGDGGKEAKK